MRHAIFLLFIVFLAFTSCKNQPAPLEESFEYEKLQSDTKVAKEVIYSMYLPTDMADVFTHAGANYMKDVPAPIDNLVLYSEQEQIALMLGILGVDLMYMKLLDQSLPAAQYYKAIENLSQKIDIPIEIFEKSSNQMNKYFTDEDSLALVIENIYRDTDLFFKENNKDNLAALSLVGGWVEAMYIGIEIYQADSSKNQMMAERILQQKFSLNSIYTILSNHQESLSVKGYLLMLKKLKKIFETVEIRYQKEGFSVDTTQKKFKTFNADIKYKKESMDDLSRIIPQIRAELIQVRAEK